MSIPGSVDANLELETELFNRYAQLSSLGKGIPVIIGIDEVGRGSIAGPVSVGIAAITFPSEDIPVGLTDSKKLTAKRRENLVSVIEKWALAVAVGHATNQEIDCWGLMTALRLAGHRALAEIKRNGVAVVAGIIDGPLNWMEVPPADLFMEPGHPDLQLPTEVDFPILTRVKADLSCASVAAASVVAKVNRDQLMTEVDDPGYGWAKNKGYSSAKHIEALKNLGVSDFHRRSWKLPGISQ